METISSKVENREAPQGARSGERQRLNKPGNATPKTIASSYAGCFSCTAIHRSAIFPPLSPRQRHLTHAESVPLTEKEMLNNSNGHGSSEPMPSSCSRFQSLLLSRKEAAAYLGVAEQTLAIWKTTGRYSLPVVKIGRDSTASLTSTPSSPAASKSTSNRRGWCLR